MKLQLNKSLTEKLLKYPESGMGFQRADLVLKSGEIIKDLLILNAEYVDLPEKYKMLKLEDIADIVKNK